MTPDQIVSLLPGVLQRACAGDGALSDVVDVMSSMHEPVEAVLDDFGRFVDPLRCPPTFLPFLAHWVGLGWMVGPRRDGRDHPAGDGALRNTIVHAASLAAQRGTLRGLRRFLTLATDRAGYEIETAGDLHLRIRAPESARPVAELVAAVVRHEKPVFVTADLAFGDDPFERLRPIDAPQLTGEPHA